MQSASTRTDTWTPPPSPVATAKPRYEGSLTPRLVSSRPAVPTVQLSPGLPNDMSTQPRPLLFGGGAPGAEAPSPPSSDSGGGMGMPSSTSLAIAVVIALSAFGLGVLVARK